MITYWIVGVLVESGPVEGKRPFTCQSESRTLVAWSGFRTKEMQPYRLVPFTSGRWRYEGTIKGEDFKPYGFTRARTAFQALKELKNRGPAFMPLLNVTGLNVRAVLIDKDGIAYATGDLE
jgi:hypothetical protein